MLSMSAPLSQKCSVPCYCDLLSDTKKTMIRPVFCCRRVRIVCSPLLHRLRPI